ncbi:MAG TPA: hypothetical protein EYM65_01290, partial [Dehalococcoidia bacterium]|nr:hypothetical protein [Dehalococcoidia bacterium]
LALVVIVPFLPGPRTTLGLFTEEAHHEPSEHSDSAPESRWHHHHSPLDNFEHQLKLFVDVGLFFFAFANAGVAFSSINAVTAIVLISLIAGKLIGVTVFSYVAILLGFPLPTGMKLKHLIVAATIAGLGLTVALFVAGKAFTGPPFQDPAKMGAVLSAGVALIAFGLGYILKVKDGGGADLAEVEESEPVAETDALPEPGGAE